MPCEHIETCTITTNYAFDKRQKNNNELYRVFGLALSCKRDNPNFVPYTKEQLSEMYSKETVHAVKFEEAFEELTRLGIVIDK